MIQKMIQSIPSCCLFGLLYTYIFFPSTPALSATVLQNAIIGYIGYALGVITYYTLFRENEMDAWRLL